MRLAMFSLGDTNSQAPEVFSARSRTKDSDTALPTPTVKILCLDLWASSIISASVSQTSPSVISRMSAGNFLTLGNL